MSRPSRQIKTGFGHEIESYSEIVEIDFVYGRYNVLLRKPPPLQVTRSITAEHHTRRAVLCSTKYFRY